MRAVKILAVLLMLGSPVLADIIHLTDDSTVSGDLKRSGDGWDVYRNGKFVQHVIADQVRSIELTPKGDPKDLAQSRLLSLRRSVEALTDLKVIIDRFEKFVEMNKGTPAAIEAKKDLAMWTERRDKGMVKMGTRWVAPEEKGAVQEKALAFSEQARQMLKQNRMKDAEAAIANALADDPNSISALYLKGLILFRQDKAQEARKAFEAVKEIAPDHGPTLNNLAVILWRQNQRIAALNLYLQAMQAMPLNKEILNNVAEALNMLNDKERTGPVPQKVFKAWTDQDNQLQQQMMPLGWYRWGATWVDKGQYEKLQAAEKEVKDKIEKLEGEFADAERKLSEIAGRIQANIEAMNYVERSRYFMDASGRTIVYPLPPQWWEYDRANRQLEVQRKETVALMDALRARAQAVKQQVPVPKFTGSMFVIGVEGTPVVIPADKPAAVNLSNELGGGGEKPKVTPGGGKVKPDPTKVDPATRPDPAKPPVDRPLKY